MARRATVVRMMGRRRGRVGSSQRGMDVAEEEEESEVRPERRPVVDFSILDGVFKVGSVSRKEGIESLYTLFPPPSRCGFSTRSCASARALSVPPEESSDHISIQLSFTKFTSC